jgi:hypothetical protein
MRARRPRPLAHAPNRDYLTGLARWVEQEKGQGCVAFEGESALDDVGAAGWVGAEGEPPGRSLDVSGVAGRDGATASPRRGTVVGAGAALGAKGSETTMGESCGGRCSAGTAALAGASRRVLGECSTMTGTAGARACSERGLPAPGMGNG